MIYFIESEDGRYVKIGKSNNVLKRLRTLQVANPGLRLLGVIEERPGMLESDLQARFEADHHEGEWFTNSPQIVSFAKTLDFVMLPARRTGNGLRKPRSEPAEITSFAPGFERVGRTIRVFGKRHPIGAATTRKLREHVRQLVQAHRIAAQADPVLLQARALLALMEKHASTNERITVGEVLNQAGPTPSEEHA